MRPRRRWGVAIALAAGSFAFGLPFLWLLLTSFKEQSDIDSPRLSWAPTIAQFAKVGQKRLPLVSGVYDGRQVVGVATEMEAGRAQVRIVDPAEMAGMEYVAGPGQVEPVRRLGLRWQNYTDSLKALPPGAHYGLSYLANTSIVAILSVIGTVLCSSLVAYGFARLRFPGRDALFVVLLSTLMLPSAVKLVPTFLLFRSLGWIDTLLPLWAPTFFGSAIAIFLLRQFFLSVPLEQEDAAKIDGCSHLRAYWSVMLPQVKPALAALAIWTFVASWGDFMGPLIYLSSSEKMTLSYALQLFSGEEVAQPGLLAAFALMAMLPVLLAFLFGQRYFIEGARPSAEGRAWFALK